jgi:thiamine-phosphate pyrophosphorylase
VILCAITDRRRSDPIAQAQRAAEAGIDLVQLRERDLDAASLASMAARMVREVSGSPTRIIVNDRLDVALACGAHGVHLRSDSIRASAARTLAPPGFLVGRSVHGVDDAAGAGSDLDYLIAGTVFATASKPQPPLHSLLGAAGLRDVAASVRVPVLAIGGITLDRIAAAARAGAGGIAAIGLFAGGGRRLVIAAAVRERFDSARGPS